MTNIFLTTRVKAGKAIILSMLFLTLGALGSNRVEAAPGDFDPAFGRQGQVTTPLGYGKAMALQPDGKIVVAGIVVVRSGNQFVDNFQVARYQPDGSLDVSFGAGGRVVTDFFGTGAQPNAVALQSDGKIVVAGYTQTPKSVRGYDFALARYNIDGSLDSTFGSGGKVTTDFQMPQTTFESYDQAKSVAIQSDGKIVAAGVGQIEDPKLTSITPFARYNKDGSLDSTFGSGGKLVSNGDGAAMIAIQSDGKIVSVGLFMTSDVGRKGFLLTRYNPNGSLDSSFGTGGRTMTDFAASPGPPGVSAQPSAIVIQPDGQIVAAGSFNIFNSQTGNSTSGFALARYKPDGNLDSAFGSGGKTLTTFTQDGPGSVPDQGNAVAIGPDGKIVAAGSIFSEQKIFYLPDPILVYENDMGVARYNPDGSPDLSFGGNGTRRVHFNKRDRFFNTEPFYSVANGVAVQADRKIVLAGYNSVGPGGGNTYFALARLLDTQPILSAVQFAAPNFFVNKGAPAATITLTRTGDTTTAATAYYITDDSTAKQDRDYTLSSGSVNFAPGQTSQTFSVLLTNNAYLQSPPPSALAVNLTLLSASRGVALGTPSFARLQIMGDGSTTSPNTNPIDDSANFVRQHYHDLLAREPDSGGLTYWTGQIAKCGSDSQCLRSRRIAVSDAFFFEPEFQETGAYMYRAYKAAFGIRPAYIQFMLGREGIIIGASVDANKTTFADALAQRPEFVSTLPYDPAAYVDALNINIGGALSQAQRDELVAGLQSGMETRGSALRKVAENQTFADHEYNSSFILMQYFGYLRRDPEPSGFDFWLKVLNQYPFKDLRGQHSLVCAFITSKEYQQRFGAVVTHDNKECSAVQ